MEPKYVFEQFSESELMFNLTNHFVRNLWTKKKLKKTKNYFITQLVPQHQVLNSEEKQELLVRYKLKENQLPRILMADPVARYYGLKRGQVVRIIRTSETAGRYVSYRLVC